MVRRYFGTDGIRGRANKVITPELALKVGQAAGLIFKNGEHRHRVLIGKDTRLSGYMIENALVAGFTSVGMDVLLTGPIPTPGVAMLAHTMRADLGVMISASHNPFDDNGIKIFGPDGFKLSDDVELKIEALLDSDMSKQLASGKDLGSARRRAGSLSKTCASLSIARTAPLTRWRPGPCGSSAPRSSPSGSIPTASILTRTAVLPTSTRSPARCARCAPTLASRWTVTPTACSSSTSSGTSSMATNCSRSSPRAGRKTAGFRIRASCRR